MKITRILNFRGSNGRADLRAVFDPAASYSRIAPERAATLATIRYLPEPLELEALSDRTSQKAEQSVVLDFYLNDLRMSDEFIAVPVANADIVIGALTMRKWQVKLDLEQGEIITDPRVGKLILR